MRSQIFVSVRLLHRHLYLSVPILSYLYHSTRTATVPPKSHEKFKRSRHDQPLETRIRYLHRSYLSYSKPTCHVPAPFLTTPGLHLYLWTQPQPEPGHGKTFKDPEPSSRRGRLNFVLAVRVKAGLLLLKHFVYRLFRN